MTMILAPETVPIPASHLGLLTKPICAVLTTTGRDGQPQSSVVWVDVDGECARINTTLERQEGRNMLADPNVSLLVVDSDDTAVTSTCSPSQRSTREASAGRIPETRAPMTGAIRFTSAIERMEVPARWESSSSRRSEGHRS
jgi:hypothetical protein